MHSGRLVDPREHRIPGNVYIARPTPSRNRPLPVEVGEMLRRGIERVEKLRAFARRRD